MAKRRMISQELIYDLEYNSMSLEAQLLFLRLLTVSDDFGFVPANEYTLTTLTNPHPRIKKSINKYLNEIVDTGLGFVFEYNGNKYFGMKRSSFDNYQSYVITKRTKSEYLKISKEIIQSEKFQEILGNYRKVISDDIESIKKKEESSKQKEEMPGFAEFFEYAQTLEIYDPKYDFEIKAKYNAWKDNDWKDGHNKLIRNWKTKLQNTMPHFKGSNGNYKKAGPRGSIDKQKYNSEITTVSKDR